MPTIKTIENLIRYKEEALEKRQMKTDSLIAQIVVGMGTCGIAAGARDTMTAIQNEIETKELSGILVTQTGCVGLCEYEPIVQVALGEGQKVTYGRVTPAVALQIIKDHVLNGQPVADYLIEI